MKEKHLKFNVNTSEGRVHECIWWRAAERNTATPRPGECIELAYAMEANCWNGRTRLQLVVEDLKEGDK